MALRQRILSGASAIATRARNFAARVKAEVASNAMGKTKFNPRGATGSVARTVVAPALGGSIGAAGRGITFRGAVTGVRNLAQRAVGNPLAGRTFMEFLKARAGGALGAATFLIGTDIAAKNAFNTGDIARTVTAAAFNPIGAVVGTVIRGGKGAFNLVKQGAERIPEVTWRDFAQPNFNFTMPESNPNFNVSTGAPNVILPESIGGSLGGGFSPSISVGGGPDVTPLLLALLGGGALGYVAGRKRRKKYKRRKRKK